MRALEPAAVQPRRLSLSAAKRLDLLLDEGSLLQLDTPIRGIIGGLGSLDGRPVAIFTEDPEERAPAPSPLRAEKVCRIFDLAIDHRAPLISMYGPPAEDSRGDGGLAGCPQIAVRAARLSGVVPQLAVLFGVCRGAAASAASLADFVICVDGEETDAAEPSDKVPFAMNAARRGYCDLGVDNAAAALLFLRELFSYLPCDALEPSPLGNSDDDPERRVDWIEDLVPVEGFQAYDMTRLVRGVADDGQFVEVMCEYARNMVIGFARFGNRAAGIIANQPSHLAGVIDFDAACKAARFMRFCDAFNIPLITFVDVPGFLPGVQQELSGMIRHGAKLGYACCEATSPKISLVVRKAYGGAFAVMCSKHMGGDINLAYPSAEIAVMGPEAAVGLLYREEIRKAGDQADQVRATLVAKYRATFSHPYAAAELGHLDAVIPPRETRMALTRALRQLESKKPRTPRRKHGNVPL
ncbi:MAG TPA: carboxyl transferase domain-containing protein [Thermoanaerobaculia bacterium]|nr:carboxyl transferase domain-containing protein [Thermoanaerobaculia bacterium]